MLVRWQYRRHAVRSGYVSEIHQKGSDRCRVWILHTDEDDIMRYYYKLDILIKCMNFNRRHFCSTLAIGSTGIVSGAVSAQSEIQITGSIDSSIGATVSGIELFFQQVDTGSKWTYTVPADGSIDLTVSETGTYRVRLFNTSSRNENIPLVYSLGQTTIEDGNSNVDYTIPDPYDTRIRCVDSDGEPVEGLQISLRAGGTGQGGLFTTSDQGYVRLGGTNKTDLQLRGRIRVEVESNQDTGSQILGNIDVLEPTEIELTISNPEKYTSNVQKVSKNPDSGFHYPYFLYTPPANQVTDSGNSTLDNIDPRPIVVGFRTWDSSSERDQKVADARSALNGNSKIRAIADELNTPAMIILIPSSTDDGRFELLNRDSLRISDGPYERLDLQIISMIDDATQRLADQPYGIANEVHLDGFSNNDRLCDQLSILHPERINAVSGGGDGFHTIPKSQYEGTLPVQSEPEMTTLEWPVGTAGLADLIGKQFNKQAWLDTALYYYIGAEDQGDNDKSDLYNEYIHAKSYAFFGRQRQRLLVNIFGWDQVDERFRTSRRIFETLDVNATFKTYDGVGHSITSDMVEDVTDFHRQQMISEFSTEHVRISEVRINPNDVDGSNPTHTLRFNVQNLSADGRDDNFTISLPNDVDVNSVTITKADGLDPVPADPIPQNQIEFTVDPESPIQDPVNMTVELDLSPSTD